MQPARNSYLWLTLPPKDPLDIPMDKVITQTDDSANAGSASKPTPDLTLDRIVEG